jgi:molecular chaperone GrpE
MSHKKDLNDDQKEPEIIDETPVENNNELDKLKDELLRNKAEFENFRKRIQTEKQDSVKLANAELIMSLLPVLDNFKRAAQHSPKTDDKNVSNWEIGIQAIARQFEDVLQSFGIIEIETIPGQPFDPRLHEAISHEKSEHKTDTIAEVIEAGYIFKDKVLRPAKVKVSA